MSTDPIVFKALLLLEQNRSLWSPKTLQKEILRKKKENPVFDHEPKYFFLYYFFIIFPFI